MSGRTGTAGRSKSKTAFTLVIQNYVDHYFDYSSPDIRISRFFRLADWDEMTPECTKRIHVCFQHTKLQLKIFIITAVKKFLTAVFLVRE